MTSLNTAFGIPKIPLHTPGTLRLPAPQRGDEAMETEVTF